MRQALAPPPAALGSRSPPDTLGLRSPPDALGSRSPPGRAGPGRLSLLASPAPLGVFLLGSGSASVRRCAAPPMWQEHGTYRKRRVHFPDQPAAHNGIAVVAQPHTLGNLLQESGVAAPEDHVVDLESLAQ